MGQPPNPEQRFSGQPQTEWLTSADQDDREMMLLKPFSYVDWAGTKWESDGFAIDGASIPRALWTAIGSPYTGRYRRASIVHDAACRSAVDAAARKRADMMFYQACRDGGCGTLQATILYTGVRIGAILDGPKPMESMSLAPMAEETREDRERQMILTIVARDPAVVQVADSDDIDLIDQHIQAAGNRALHIVKAPAPGADGMMETSAVAVPVWT